MEYERYGNILEFAEKWRKYKVNHVKLNQADFSKNINIDGYIYIACFNEEYKTNVSILLFNPNTKYVTTNAQMKLLINEHIKIMARLGGNVPGSVYLNEILLITEKNLSIHHNKFFNTKNLDVSIENYMYRLFNIITPRASCVADHRILSKDEVMEIMNEDLKCNVVYLPKILITDPICIWLGAKIGHVIEVKNLSEVCGYAISYNLVIPKGRKIRKHDVSKYLLAQSEIEEKKSKPSKSDAEESDVDDGSIDASESGSDKSDAKSDVNSVAEDVESEFDENSENALDQESSDISDDEISDSDVTPEESDDDLPVKRGKSNKKK